MLRRMLALTLGTLLMHAGGALSLAQAGSKAEAEARFAAKIKAGILKLGTGEQARVQLKLRDKTKLTGYVGEAGPDSFVVKDFKTGAATVVAYPQVKQIKGHNLSTGAKIAIGVGIVVAALVITALIIVARCDGRLLDC
jgi:hypothetical protein